MWYIFKNDGTCVGCCSEKPNMADLSTRSEFAIKNDNVFDIENIILTDGNIKQKETTLETITETTETIDQTLLALAEALAAQDERLTKLEGSVTA